MLGVIIQGATRNTTVSVKIGDSEKSYGGGGGGSRRGRAPASESTGPAESRTTWTLGKPLAPLSF